MTGDTDIASLAAALADRLFALRWIRRADRGRAVFVTDAGAEGLFDTLGLRLSG